MTRALAPEGTASLLCRSLSSDRQFLVVSNPNALSIECSPLLTALKCRHSVVRRRAVAISPVEIQKTAINRVISAGDESRRIGAQVQCQGCNFIRLTHAPDRLCPRKFVVHLLLATGIS